MVPTNDVSVHVLLRALRMLHPKPSSLQLHTPSIPLTTRLGLGSAEPPPLLLAQLLPDYPVVSALNQLLRLQVSSVAQTLELEGRGAHVRDRLRSHEIA